MTAPLVQTRGIVRRDARTAKTLLAATDFALVAGARTAVTGPSGAGKSVFLRALALLDPLDDGEVLWRGRCIARADIPRYRRSVAYVRQRPALVDGSVEDNLRYPYTLHTYRDVTFDRTRAAALAERAGRGGDFLGKRAADLSGGEAQIAALVRVLQLSPEVLLLDEPTASLDPQAARAVEALVDAWFDEAPAERAFIWVSHDPAQASRVSDRQVPMTAGRLGHAAGPHP
jgi:putative ABC transport system ATP-binding protein